jgi:hypothetical protein
MAVNRKVVGEAFMVTQKGTGLSPATTKKEESPVATAARS